ALDEAYITVPIACDRHVRFHYEAVGRCCKETRESCVFWVPIFSKDATFHLVHGVVLCVRACCVGLRPTQHALTFLILAEPLPRSILQGKKGRKTDISIPDLALSGVRIQRHATHNAQ